MVPRPDVDWMWSAQAARCRQRLPDELWWARPLLDGVQPIAVLCAAEQARALIVWHNHLPTDQQVAFTCRRQPPARRGAPPTAPAA